MARIIGWTLLVSGVTTVVVANAPDDGVATTALIVGVVAEAQQRSRGPVDPSLPGRVERVAQQRGIDWCTAVLGVPFHGCRYLNHTEAQLLLVADERDVDPPLPQWIVDDRERAGHRDVEMRERREAIADRDNAAWAAVLDQVQVALHVHTSLTARPRGGFRHHLGHAVPAVDVFSGGRRLHRAGRALCETVNRPKPLQLSDHPSDDPVTCDRCLAWAPKVRGPR